MPIPIGKIGLYGTIVVAMIFTLIFFRDAWQKGLGTALGESGTGFGTFGSSLGSFGAGLGGIGSGFAGLLGGVSQGFTSLLTTPIGGFIDLAGRAQSLFGGPSNNSGSSSAPSGGTGGMDLMQSTAESSPSTSNIVTSFGGSAYV